MDRRDFRRRTNRLWANRNLQRALMALAFAVNLRGLLTYDDTPAWLDAFTAFILVALIVAQATIEITNRRHDREQREWRAHFPVADPERDAAVRHYLDGCSMRESLAIAQWVCQFPEPDRDDAPPEVRDYLNYVDSLDGSRP